MDKRGYYIAMVVGLLAGLFGYLLTAGSLGINIDGRSYWEGSVSLLRGNGYVMLDGRPIVSWPPSYSIYLAVWQSVFGVSGATLILANAGTTAIKGFMWTLLFLRVFRLENLTTGDSASRIFWPPVILAVGILPVQLRAVHAMNLFDALLPLFILQMLVIIEGQSDRRTMASVGLLAVSMALPLIHNAGVTVLIAGSIVLFLGTKNSRRRFTVVVPLIGLLTWQLLRIFLGLQGSHALALGAGRYDAMTYLLQVFHGTLTFGCLPLLPCIPIVSVLATGVYLSRLTRLRRHVLNHMPVPLSPDVKSMLLLTGLNALLLFVLFNLVWINDELAGRFLFPHLLILTATALWLTLQYLDRRMRTITQLLLLLPFIIHLAGLLTVYRFGMDEYIPQRPAEKFITPDARPDSD